jgi:hypothetical protein
MWCGVGGAEPGLRLTAVSGAEAVRPEGPVSGADAARIAAARGEYESFQVVVTATGGNVVDIRAELGELRNESGGVIGGNDIAIYRAVYVPIRHSSPRAELPPGLVADPLVPFKNPYTGEAIPVPKWGGEERIGPRFGAVGFELWEGHNQPLWVDVRVPVDAAPGTYTGTFRVQAGGGVAAELPVELTVWDFALPAGPSHENHFGGFGRVAAYHGLKGDSEEFRVIEERYAQMMADHRINPPLPGSLRPAVGEDGTVEFLPELDARISEFVARYRVTNIEIPRAPFGDSLGADREKALRFYRSWYAYLEKKGWADRSYHYMLDEPNTVEQYETVRQLGALLHEAEPRIRRLVVEQTYVQDPAWGSLDDAIDIWCPLFGFVHEGSIADVVSRGDDVWSYTALVQPAPPYHPEYEQVKSDNPPYWQMDFPVTAYRIAPWLNRRYGITGLLYWSTVYWGSPERNPWDDPGFRVRWNGEGALFYPGDEAGIEGPVASIRLKNLRDGMEDYEYFVLLEERDGKAAVEEIVRSAVPTWGSWQRDPNQLLELRRRLAEGILRR